MQVVLAPLAPTAGHHILPLDCGPPDGIGGPVRAHGEVCSGRPLSATWSPPQTSACAPLGPSPRSPWRVRGRHSRAAVVPSCARPPASSPPTPFGEWHLQRDVALVLPGQSRLAPIRVGNPPRPRIGLPPSTAPVCHPSRVGMGGLPHGWVRHQRRACPTGTPVSLGPSALRVAVPARTLEPPPPTAGSAVVGPAAVAHGVPMRGAHSVPMLAG